MAESEQNPRVARGPGPLQTPQAQTATAPTPASPAARSAAAATAARNGQRAGAMPGGPGVRSPQGRVFPVQPNPSDMAYPFWMPWGIEGDVNRVRPWSIIPKAVDHAAPQLAFGRGVMWDETSQRIRRLTPADAAEEDIFGITVRPYPFQSTTLPGSGDYGAVGFGTALSPLFATMDVLELGYIMVRVFNGGTTHGGQKPVYVWCGDDEYDPGTGELIHANGGFEAAAGATTIELSRFRTTWHGQRGNIAELRFNL